MKIPDSLKWKHAGRTLGQGGQAEVYMVTNEEEGDTQVYAMKILSRGRPRKAYERFYREIEAIRTLDHPNIVKIYDQSQPGDEFSYYVMEFIEGADSLKRLMSKRTNPFYGDPLKSLGLLIQLFEVIRACESIDVVHRDLKPANILVLPDESIRVIDFGICQIEGHETITLVDEAVGAANYMAPECESGAEGEASSRSDIYSAGKVLWSAMTNLMAFSRESPAFGGKSMQSVFPEKPETWHLHHIFERTIRRDPNIRYQTADEAFHGARLVESLVRREFPPLEHILKRCPICGIGTLKGFSRSHEVFGNPNPPGIHPFQCDRCGYCFPINVERVKRDLALRKELE